MSGSQSRARFGALLSRLLQRVSSGGRQGHSANIRVAGGEGQRVPDEGHGRGSMAVHSHGKTVDRAAKTSLCGRLTKVSSHYWQFKLATKDALH